MIVNGASSALKESFAKRGVVLEELKTGIALKYHNLCKSKGQSCLSNRAPVGSRHSEIACRPSPVSLDASILFFFQPFSLLSFLSKGAVGFSASYPLGDQIKQITFAFSLVGAVVLSSSCPLGVRSCLNGV